MNPLQAATPPTPPPDQPLPPRRVLLYCVLDHHGGIETHIRNLARALRARGAEVWIAAKWVHSASRYEAEFAAMGVRLVHPRLNARLVAMAGLPVKLKSLLANGLAELHFRRTLPAGHFDVVSINATGMFGSRLRRCVKPQGGRLTYHEHQTLPQPLAPDAPNARLLQAMDFVSVNSQRDAGNARSGLRQAQALHVMPALAAPIAAPALQAPRPANHPLRVAFVGNIAAREKGAHKLLALWRRLRPVDMQLTFYGTHAERLGPLSDVPHVRAAGPFRPAEVSRVFGEIDLLVHPADDESLGLVLVEAMAHGVPFVATHVGGIIDIAQDNPHVLTIANTEAALEAAILTMKARIHGGQLDSPGLRALYETRWSHEALGERWAWLYL